MKDFDSSFDNSPDVFIFNGDTAPGQVTQFGVARAYEFGGLGQYEAQTLGNSGVTVVESFGDAKGGNGGGGKPDGGGGGGGKPGGGGEPGVLTEYTSGSSDGSGFNITIEFSGTWTVALQQSFIDAAEFLSDLILADMPDIDRGRYATDDITISASLTDIDGIGGILGQAGPTVVRSADGTPVAGIMEFDIADAADFDAMGLFNDIVLHEMLHTLGFGTLWDYMGLTSGSIATGDLVFTGQNANDVYETEFADIASSDGFVFGVPIEMDGGSGTAGGHWDETLFVNEIMTGYINDANYLSLMSIAALEDMGYDTVFDNPYDPNDLSGAIPTTHILSDAVLLG